MLRALTPKERKEIFKETGFTVMNYPAERTEEFMWKILEKVTPKKVYKTFKEEEEAAAEIIRLTYSVSEEDEKN